MMMMMMIKKKFSDEFCRTSSRVLHYSVQTRNPTDNTLYHNLIRYHQPSIVPVLDQWVAEEKPVSQQDLHRIIKQLRKFGRYKHALQVLFYSSITKICILFQLQMFVRD